MERANIGYLTIILILFKVSEDGYLHFDYCSFDPHAPTFDKHLIAPLWHQYEQATVYYRQTTKPFDLDVSNTTYFGVITLIFTMYSNTPRL